MAAVMRFVAAHHAEQAAFGSVQAMQDGCAVAELDHAIGKVAGPAFRYGELGKRRGVGCVHFQEIWNKRCGKIGFGNLKQDVPQVEADVDALSSSDQLRIAWLRSQDAGTASNFVFWYSSQGEVSTIRTMASLKHPELHLLSSAYRRIRRYRWFAHRFQPSLPFEVSKTGSRNRKWYSESKFVKMKQ